jgi:hypothetical protein
LNVSQVRDMQNIPCAMKDQTINFRSSTALVWGHPYTPVQKAYEQKLLISHGNPACLGLGAPLTEFGGGGLQDVVHGVRFYILSFFRC